MGLYLLSASDSWHISMARISSAASYSLRGLPPRRGGGNGASNASALVYGKLVRGAFGGYGPARYSRWVGPGFAARRPDFPNVPTPAVQPRLSTLPLKTSVRHPCSAYSLSLNATPLFEQDK